MKLCVNSSGNIQFKTNKNVMKQADSCTIVLKLSSTVCFWLIHHVNFWKCNTLNIILVEQITLIR